MNRFNDPDTDRAATDPQPAPKPDLDGVLFWPLAKPPEGVTRFLDDKGRVIDLAAKPGLKSCTFPCTWEGCEEWLIVYRNLTARARWPKYCWLHKTEARRATWRKSKQHERSRDYIYTEFNPDDHDYPWIEAEEYLRYPREASPEARHQARTWLTERYHLEEPLDLDDDLARILLDTSWKYKERDEAYNRVREQNGYKVVRIDRHHSEYSVGDPFGPRPRALSIDPVCYPGDWSGPTPAVRVGPPERDPRAPQGREVTCYNFPVTVRHRDKPA